MHTTAEQHDQSHPQPLEYIKIAIILAVITAVEVVTYYVTAIGDMLVPILLVLSAIKFAMVVMWFMHLKFDNKLFSVLFIGGLVLAGLVLLALLLLFILSGNMAGTQSVAPLEH